MSSVFLATFSLDVDETSRRALELLLDADERLCANSFKFPIHQHRYIAAHARTRQILGCWLDDDPRALTFARNCKGKPVLIQPRSGKKESGFNLSHSGALGVLAYGQIKVIGVDVEEIREIENNKEFVDMFLTEEETHLIDTDESTLLLKAWTMKEACAKAIGEGLQYSLRKIKFAKIDSDRPELLEFGGRDTKLWRVKVLRLSPNHIASVAAMTEGSELEIITQIFP